MFGLRSLLFTMGGVFVAALGCARAEDLAFTDGGAGDGAPSLGGLSFGAGGALPPEAGGAPPGSGGTLPTAGGAPPGAGGTTPSAGGAAPGSGGRPPSGGASGTGGGQICSGTSCPACLLATPCCKPDNSCGCSIFGLPCG